MINIRKYVNWRKKLQHYLTVLGVAVNIHDITYPCQGLPESIGSVEICVLLLLLQCSVLKGTCIVNAYCQFSQQTCTNFMETYLYSLISTHFFILMTNLHWQIHYCFLIFCFQYRRVCLFDIGFWIGSKTFQFYADFRWILKYFGDTQILHPFPHSKGPNPK